VKNSFRETLGRHLLAIEERDLDALADTVDDDEILLVMSDGKLVRSKKEFLEAHRGWFAMKHWRLEVKPVQIIDGPALGVALLVIGPIMRLPSTRRTSRPLPPAGEACASS
jgi:ketosteroid isomerase-like protein